MYLKRLESIGFKSFAERISVEFVPGVTAVVGPNGSGKSNVTDAIRWVLGEQSVKSLRGSKMEDIIFQGSDTRKPLNIAEVTLVLDNSDKRVPLDYDEISVTRRVYRSGESAFYINKQSCRLKDIIDLFMDSGLGKEAFSIISQGKVEEILSSKAEERRTIFEEAAGVLKYKQRKKKAEYKLAETQENLNRVEDIIHEIEQQITPLKEQSEKAKRYLELKAELKSEEISYLIAEIEEMHSKWELLRKEVDAEKVEEVSVKTAIQKAEAEVEKQKQTIQNLDAEIDSQQAELLSAAEKLEKYEGKKQLFDVQTKHFMDNKEKLEKQKNETSVKIGEKHDVLVAERKRLAELKKQKEETKTHASDLESRLTKGSQSIADEIEDLKSDYIELLNKQAATRNEKQSISLQLQQISGKTDKQAAKFKEMLTLRAELEEKTDRIRAAFHTQEEKVGRKSQELIQLKKDLESERTGYEDSQEKLYQGYQYIEKLKSRKEMLEEMKEDFQGFFHGVKAILKARDDQRLQGILGAVIELVDVPKNYITAIETVLGGQAQHLVVTDDQAARNAIAWLKKTNNGRATFLPLGSIQERSIQADIRSRVSSHSGFIGIASELVHTEAAYQRAVNHLMGHVIIAATLKDANEMAALVQRRFRIVTLEGDVVNPGGSMSGGAQKKNNQSLFTREKDLQEITEKLNDYENRILQFERIVTERKQKAADLMSRLSETEQILGQERQILQEMQSELKENELRLDTMNDNLAIYDLDKQQHSEDEEALKKRDAFLTESLAKIRTDLESIQTKIDRLSEQEAQLKQNKEQLQHSLHQLQLQLAEQEERYKSQKEKTMSVESQLKALQTEYDSYQLEYKKLLEFEDTPETEEEINQKIEKARLDKETLTLKIQEMRNRRMQETKLAEDKEREIKQEQKKHQDFLQSLQQKEVQVNRLDVELENRLNHLQAEYTITFERARQDYEKAEDTEAAKNKVQELKAAINRLGTVYIGAIEDYERVSERYHFLSEQKDDLTQAKDTLFTVINEMDEEMKIRFEGTFSRIRQEFSEVFKQLFGGGHAELKLTDPGNLLDTGVDIIAQPPGKKLQHLGLLSGGERALTAIALLFSILRVRPVPFCILDEVEAALDEANVVRFAKYVKHYSENTQFIVITHRKGTMEEADVLYGITMQESGVSRLVSVRLEDTKELINS